MDLARYEKYEQASIYFVFKYQATRIMLRNYKDYAV